MNEGDDKHSSVNKTFQIDQRAIKTFLGWLPDNWLAREQKPDFFVDYLVEIVENGEPTGKHFGVQVKGYEESQKDPKPFSYSFKTKHLNYYLHKSQHPIFLLLINISSGEGYWIFAQKFLRDNAASINLNGQKTLTIHFNTDDSLFNFTKFKYSLPEAERFVRDMHPGSPLAAIQKRIQDLESIDPRCAVQVNFCDGLEQIVIKPKKPFSFSLNVKSKNVEGWKAFVEKGEMIKTTPGEVSFVGMPLFQEALNESSEIHLQIAQRQSASLNIINCNGEFPAVTHIDGTFITGTKFSRFVGEIPNSPLTLSFELPHEYLDTRRSVDLSIKFSLSKWAGQPILNLVAFDKIKTFAESFSGEKNPKIEIFVGEVRQVRGELGGKNTPTIDFIIRSLDWLLKCKWLAEHFKVNPTLPKLDVFTQVDFDTVQELQDILRFRKIVCPKPYLELSVEAEPVDGTNIAPAETAKSLKLQSMSFTFNFFGAPIKLPPIEHIFSEVNLFSRSPIAGSKMENLVFKGNEKSYQFSSLIK